ncbi:helix-turn-helix domain-containing protein [uncultured Tateyamaria sp.]|uniref:helix-turn-helix domain-containing protein n=1 Tax=uncultured Tateyamaria sp. TaxID=455651 RepID=UPI002624A963|nr:helix-turn-helix domain-containing protein [uncultured Tateyamaria sp.]
MSQTLRFDRRKGFVALPVEVLELDLSPGAFRLLVELCRMANLDGFCWPSLGQLGERLGRSKAAISGYITALRDAELISTETQTTANGYNYRLRYCVTFWKAWRASLSGKVTADIDQKDERSVRQGERHMDSKNHIQINHDPVERSVYSELVSDWAACTKGAPYPALKHEPRPDLVAATQVAISRKAVSKSVMSADIDRQLENVFADLRVEKDQAAQTLAAKHLAGKNLSKDEVAALCSSIKTGWQSHWRKVPGPKQLDQMLKSAQIVPQNAQIKLLEGYLRRWALAQKTLRAATPCEKLPLRSGVPAPPEAPTYIRGYN